MRFSVPHFRHLLSIRVSPCLTVRVLRSNASFTKRSDSSRISCFDISRFLAFKANLTPYFWPRAPNVIGCFRVGSCAAGNEQENQYPGFQRHLVSPVSSRNDILCL